MTDQETTNGAGPTCSTGGCSASRNVLWILLLVIAGSYVYSTFVQSREVESDFPWVKSFEEAQAKAQQTNQPLFVKFHATWCGPCRAMERDVFSKPEVAEALSNWVSVSVDVDKNGRLADKYGVRSIPTLIAMDAQGEPMAAPKGIMSADVFVEWINTLEEKHALAPASTDPS